MDTVDQLLEALDAFDPTLGTFRKLRTQMPWPSLRNGVRRLLLDYMDERSNALVPGPPTEFQKLTETAPAFDQAMKIIKGIPLLTERNLAIDIALYAVALSNTSYGLAPWNRVRDVLLLGDIKQDVRESLAQLDGSTQSAVTLLSGVPAEEMDLYGGFHGGFRDDGTAQ